MIKTKKTYIRKVISIIIALITTFAFVSCKDSQGEVVSNNVDNSTNSSSLVRNLDGKILIAYFAVAENSDVDAVSSASVVTENGESRGRIRILADNIKEVVGGDLFSIETSIDYPGNGGELIEYANDEKEDNVRPELTSHIENIDDYDVVFVGYPNWWYDMPMAMYSFFDEYDFSDKTIIPFNSHNGSRFSNTINTIQELEPNATVIMEGFTINERAVAKSKSDVEEWLNSLDY